MPLVVKDRVRETSTTAGTGTFTLAGAVLGYQSFSAIGDGNTTYYTIYLQGGNEWEVGIGTYTASGATLSRDTILASSNAGSAVNFSAGTKDVFVTYPAGRSVWYDSATNVTLNALTLSGGTQNGVLYLNASRVATSGSALTFDGSNLGIGISPLYRVHASNDADAFRIVGMFENPNTGTSAQAAVRVKAGTNTATMGLGGSGVSGAAVYIGADQATPVLYYTGNSYHYWQTATTEKMRLEQSGTLILRQSSNAANTSVSLNTTIQNALTLEADGDLLVGTTTNTNSSKLVASGTISETVSSTQYLVASQFDIGTAANEIPLNQYLGNLAYQDAGSIAGQVGLSAGTAALPSLVSATDTDTGMWFPAANTLAWSTGGTQVVTINSSQNVGIGEPNPGVRLDVSGQGRVLYNTGATNTGDQSVVTVGATTSGAYASTYGAGLQFQVTNSGGGYAGGRILSRLGADNFTANLVFQARNYGYTDSMTLDASGNLLLGGTSTTQLDGVFGQIIGSSSKTTAGIALETSAGAYLIYTDSSDALIFWDSGSNVERARISSDGTFRVKGAGTAGTTDAVQFSGSAPANSLILDSSGVLKENGYAVVSQADIGTAPNEVPLNQYLGTMAYQDGTNYFNTGMTMGFRNRIINGAMQIDQRNAGASFTVSTDYIYTIDRFIAYKAGSVNNFTAQQSTTAPPNFKNSILYTAGTGVTPTGGDYAGVAQKIEGLNVVDFGFGTSSAKSVSISFWIRCSLTGTFGGYARNGDTGNRSYIFAFTINSANTWEYKTVVIPGDTTGTWATDTAAGFQVGFDLGVGPTYSADAGSWISANRFGLTGGVKLLATTGATMHISGLQLEVGTQATPFDWRPYTTELQLCQRYYQKSFSTGSAPANGVATGSVVRNLVPYSTTQSYMDSVSFATEMRTSPTITIYNTSAIATTNAIAYYDGAWQAATSSTVVKIRTGGFAPEASGSFTAYVPRLGEFAWAASAEL